MKTEPQVVVGLDMATDWRKQGVAVGNILVDGRIEVTKVDNGKNLDKILEDCKSNLSLLAIDSPLGWPLSLREALREHHAGEEITIPRDEVFSRKTDIFVKGIFIEGKSGTRPMDVGADRIAKTAHAACKLLSEKNIPVLVKAGAPKCLSAIEVYPAVTRLVHTCEGSWEEQLRKNNIRFKRQDDKRWAEHRDHVFDACICLLAARDFLQGECYEPKEACTEEEAKIEGWIWVKRKDA